MSDIVMQVDVNADRRAVAGALTTESGIKGWWTDQAELSDGSDAMLKPSFVPAPMPFDLAVTESGEDGVAWRAQSFPPNWVGTEVRFALSDNPDGPGTRVLFSHTGFQAGDPGVPSVAYTWGQTLGRLKGYVESGTPQPYFVS
jgi:uncharacterized protein YndB with AHSA1/START domain